MNTYMVGISINLLMRKYVKNFQRVEHSSVASTKIFVDIANNVWRVTENSRISYRANSSANCSE